MSDTELRLYYTIQYQELLDVLKFLNKDCPEEVRSYNEIVDYARRIRQRAMIVGLSEYSLDPLPERK
jgi:hypothetical protein